VAKELQSARAAVQQAEIEAADSQPATSSSGIVAKSATTSN
jgi:hypothetical protein